MDNIEQISKLFIQNKFNEALILINQCMDFDEINLDQEIFLLKKKKRIHEILNIEDQETMIKLSSKFIEDRKFEESKKILETIKNKDLRILKELFNSSVSAGNLEHGEMYGHRYLSKLYKHKRYQDMKKFLETYVELGGNEKTRSEFYMKAVIGMGDIDALDEHVFKNELQNYLDGGIIGRKLEFYELFLELTNKKRRYWKSSKSYHEVRILTSMHNLEFGENRKLFINELFDRLIQFSEENKWYQLLIKYAQQFERKKIGIHALNILEENKEKLNVKHGLLKKFKLIRENFEILPDIKEEDVTHEKIDLGADLFQYSSNEENVFDKISKLERNIKFIKESTGDFKLLEPLYLKLQVLDENHPGLRDFYDRQYSEKSIQTKLKKKSIKDIEMDLIKELALYTKKTSPMDLDGEDEEERDGLIRGGKKYLDLINEIDFKENVRDYYMAFFWMDLPEVCCYSIEKYLDMYINIPLERYLVLIYLKIEALMLMKKYHLASDICESIIFEKPMVDEEKINIMYLLGEVSLKLNRKDKAHEAFSWVIRKNPKYRLAKMRLKKIEQGQ